MASATKLMMTNEPDFTVAETKHKYGTRVDCLDCDADTFINHWLPIYDKQNGIDAPPPSENTYRALPILPPKPRAKRRPKTKRVYRSRRLEQVIGVLKEKPQTAAEIARLIGLSESSPVNHIIKKNQSMFREIGRVQSGKIYAVIWGLA